MVTNGFSLVEVRKLYFDELIEFYRQTVRVLERKGEFKEGTYDKLTGKSDDAKTVLNQLRRGLSKVTQQK